MHEQLHEVDEGPQVVQRVSGEAAKDHNEEKQHHRTPKHGFAKGLEAGEALVFHGDLGRQNTTSSEIDLVCNQAVGVVLNSGRLQNLVFFGDVEFELNLVVAERRNEVGFVEAQLHVHVGVVELDDGPVEVGLLFIELGCQTNVELFAGQRGEQAVVSAVGTVEDLLSVLIHVQVLQLNGPSFLFEHIGVVHQVAADQAVFDHVRQVLTHRNWVREV